MRVKKIKNISNEKVKIMLEGGAELTLPPDVEVMNVRVSNIDEVKDKTKIVADLGEIVEVHKDTTKQLFG